VAKPVSKPAAKSNTAPKKGAPASAKQVAGPLKVPSSSTGSKAVSAKPATVPAVKAEAKVSAPAPVAKKPVKMTDEEIRRKWLESIHR
jgi:hypothetical protein